VHLIGFYYKKRKLILHYNNTPAYSSQFLVKHETALIPQLP